MPVLSALWRYGARHWRGELPLALAFWVNTVALRMALAALQQHAAASPAWLSGVVARIPPAWQFACGLAAIGVAHGLLLLWQAVGVLRSTERYREVSGSFATPWAVQIALVLALWLALADALDGWQRLARLDAPPEPNFVERMDALHASAYRLSVDSAGRALSIAGVLAPGITGRVAALMDEFPIDRVELDSEGGNIYEARGLARLFSDRGVVTVVRTRCASACTLAYIGGDRRWLADGAVLGFHRYRLDADYDVPFADTAREEARDRALYLAAGVAAGFVDRMHQAGAESMWWPEMAELRNGGVVHRIVPATVTVDAEAHPAVQ